MKARVIIERAFYETVQSKYNIEAVDLSDGLRYLNRFMARIDAQGVELGYTALASVDDAVTVPDTVILAMVKNLASLMWPQYNTSKLNPLIKLAAKRGLDAMRSQAINVIQPAQFPATLPRGSGNQDGNFDDSFYTNNQGKSTYIGAENQ